MLFLIFYFVFTFYFFTSPFALRTPDAGLRTPPVPATPATRDARPACAVFMDVVHSSCVETAGHEK